MSRKVAPLFFPDDSHRTPCTEQRPVVYELQPEQIVKFSGDGVPSDFDSFIERGDTEDLERAYAAQRLREIRKQANRRPPTFLEWLFGVPTGAGAQTNDVLGGIRNLRLQAMEAVRAGNALSAERIRMANTALEFELKRARLQESISEEELKRAQTEAAIDALSADAAVRAEERAAEIAERRLRRIKAEQAAADIVDGRATAEAQLRQQLRAAERDSEQARAAARSAASAIRSYQAGIHRRDAELNQRERQIASLRADLELERGAERRNERTRAEELRRATHRARLAEAAADRARHDADARRARRPPSAEESAFARQLAEADHQVRLAEKRAASARHQAEARKHLTPETAIERFARDARSRLRQATDKQDIYEELKRQCDERLAQIAARDGEGSEAYQDAEATFSVLLNEIREEVNQ